MNSSIQLLVYSCISVFFAVLIYWKTNDPHEIQRISRSTRRLITELGQLNTKNNINDSPFPFTSKIHFNRTLEESEFKVLPKVNPEKYNDLFVTMIFFVYIPINKNWKLLLDNYLEDTLATGIFNRIDKIYMCISTVTNDDEFTYFVTTRPESDHTSAINRLREVTAYMESKLEAYKHKIIFDITLGNLYEYPGLIRLWEDAAAIADDEAAKKHVYLYFHSKGMVHHGNLQKDNREHYREYFEFVIKPWEIVLYYFAKDPNLDKAGIECFGMTGGMRGNYFWIRGSTLRNLKSPRRSNNRYYFENWLGLRDEDPLFPKNYLLHFDYVAFEESEGHNWALPKYSGSQQQNQKCEGAWEINNKNYYIAKTDNHEDVPLEV